MRPGWCKNQQGGVLRLDYLQCVRVCVCVGGARVTQTDTSFNLIRRSVRQRGVEEATPRGGGGGIIKALGPYECAL